MVGEKEVTLIANSDKISWLSRLRNHKARLTVASKYEPPFVTHIPRVLDKQTNQCLLGILCRIPKMANSTRRWEVSCCIGTVMDLLKKLQEDLWLSIDLYLVEDGYYGSLVDGKWNGMIGEIVSGRSQMALAAMTLTTKRSTVVEFGEAFMDITLAIMLPSHTVDKMGFLNFNFVANVTGGLLLVLLLVFVSGSLLLYGLENTLRWQKNLTEPYEFREAFTYLSGITFQRDLGGKNPEQCSTRVMFVIFAFAMVIIMTTYTATLTAVQVKQEDADVFKGIKDPRVCISL